MQGGDGCDGPLTSRNGGDQGVVRGVTPVIVKRVSYITGPPAVRQGKTPATSGRGWQP